MKTKTPKKVLSFILAVMMVVTSLPMFGFVALAATSSTDAAVIEAQDAMDAFEAKLSSQGIFSNVTSAYEAYVACQEALDAYIYGGETDALDGKADALNTAIANIEEVTLKTATAIPTFSNSTTKQMEEWAGEGFQNILYSDQAVSIGSAYSQYVAFQILMSTNITVMYDGTNDILIPVMLDAYKSSKSTPLASESITDASGADTAYGKPRSFYAAYPSTTTDGSTDDNNFRLVGYWQSGGGADANWNWNWWAGMYNGAGANYDPAYSADTGYAGGGKQQADYSTSGMVIDRTGNYGVLGRGYKYTSVEYYHSNVLKYVGGDISGAGAIISIPYWYGSSGDSANSSADDKSMSGSAVNVVNYKYLTDALTTNGNKMKAVDPADFSEGGLADYIAAMEAGANFDPASYFTSSNNYSGCIAAMETLVDNMNNASVTNTDSADYETLRNTMTDALRAEYASGNQGYTEDSWAVFAEKYEAAQAIMADVNDNGYTSTQAATAASELLEAFKNLQTNVEKVDTSALISAIYTFQSYNKNYFTADSYAAVQEVVKAAKIAVWGSEENYGIATEALDLSDENQAVVDEQVLLVLDAVKTLKISPDAVVAIDNGDRYSLNTAYALANEISDPTDYGNYATFETAVNSGKDYELTTLATQEFTDLDAQLAEYETYVNAIVVAFENLQYSFTKIPDGTVTGTKSAAITTLSDSKNSGYDWWIDFSYPSSATVFRTTHDALTVNYGNTNTTFKINIDNNISKENNALDSITINGTADANTQINSSAATSTPSALSDDEKSTYAGCLSKSGFSLTNFIVTDSINNTKSYFGTTADGTAVTDRVPANDEYTTILGTTEGTSSIPAKGTIALQPYVKGDASITLTSDMNVDIPSTSSKTLTTNTVPTKTNYTYSGYFGATYAWNTQPTLAYAGYAYLTSKSNDEKISTTVSVVDMTYLVELVDKCNSILSDSAKYTEQTWSSFLSALEAAQADLDYTGMTADTILTNVKSRYSELWAAYSALELKTCTVTFEWKNSQGVDTNKVITVTYGDTLSNYTTQINSITIPGYSTAAYNYVFTGSWSPEVDLDAPVLTDATYVAVFDAIPNEADWTAYNTAKEALISKIQPKIFIAADLEALEASLQALTYFSYTEEEQATVYADCQTAIDEEAAAITTLTTNLTPIDTSVYDVDAALAAAEAGGDSDRYDLSINPYTTVTVAGDPVEALVYATQEELDSAIQAAMSVKYYTIYLNDASVVTVAYGTSIIVNSDGTYEADVEDTHPNYDGAEVAWSYSYAAPSTNYAATNPKYMVTASSFGFIVKGDTYLTTVDAASSTDIYTVKFVADLGGNSSKTYAVCYTDADGTIIDMPSAPTYAYYTFSGYTCSGANLTVNGDSYTVDGSCTIKASYTVNTVPTYNISYYNGYDAWFEGVSTSSGTYKYNELVALSGDDDAKYWFAATCLVSSSGNMVGETFDLIACGSEYSFYACQSFDEDDWDQGVYSGIVSMSQSEFESCLKASCDELFAGSTQYSYFYDGQGKEITAEGNKYVGYTYPDVMPTVTALETAVPVYDASNTLSKISLIGTFILPEGYTMVETGFLFTTVSGADMTLANVGTDGIARMKSSKYTVGHQFVINVIAPSDLSKLASFDYVAYAIIKDTSGQQIVCYSQQYNGSVDNL